MSTFNVSKSEIIFPPFGRSWGSGWNDIPGTRENYAAMAGTIYKNPTVAIGLRWIADNFLTPELVAQKGRGKGKDKPLASHPALDLLANPNPFYDVSAFWGVCALSDIIHGDTYILKAINPDKGNLELHWLNPDNVTPISDQGQFISVYEFRQGAQIEYYSPDDVIHVRNGLDPEDLRRGLSPLKACLREIVADNAASTYTSSILLNMGVPGVILTPKDSKDTILPEDASAMTKKMRATTKDGAGDPLVLSNAVDITPLGATPEQMALDTIRRYPQDNICAAMGLNTIALGLTSGAGSKTYANYEQAVKSQYHSCLMPMQDRFADALNEQLMNKLDPNVTLSWDYSGVEALQEDQTALSTRLQAQYQSNVIDRAELRSQLGYAVRPEDEGVYYQAATPAPKPKTIEDIND